MGDGGWGLLITVTQSHGSQLPKGGYGPGRLLEVPPIKVTPVMVTGTPQGQREHQASRASSLPRAGCPSKTAKAGSSVQDPLDGEPPTPPHPP